MELISKNSLIGLLWTLKHARRQHFKSFALPPSNSKPAQLLSISWWMYTFHLYNKCLLNIFYLRTCIASYYTRSKFREVRVVSLTKLWPLDQWSLIIKFPSVLKTVLKCTVHKCFTVAKSTDQLFIVSLTVNRAR